MRRPAVGLVVCLAVTASLYAPHVRGAAFVYEDLNDINTTYRPWQGLAVEAHDLVVKPARALTSAVDRLVGFDPQRQHLVSLGLHLFAGVLVYLVALAVLPEPSALIAAAVFLLAPWQVEAVAYAAARSDVLVTLAVLLGVLAIETDRFWLAGLCAVAAVLAKESGIVAWLLLPAWAMWRGQTWPLGWILGWALVAWAGATVALTTRDLGAHLTWPPVVDGLQALGGLLLTPPWGFSVDPARAALWPILAVGGVAVVAWWRSPHWTALVVGGVLLAWAPRLLVATAETPKYHHLYLPLAILSLGVGRLVVPADYCG